MAARPNCKSLAMPRMLCLLFQREMIEVVPVFRARSGLRMNGQGDLQDERKEQEAGVECTTTVHR